ncbi:MAG: class I SAM-dependent methyltransferase [Bacillota bacterium]
MNFKYCAEINIDNNNNSHSAILKQINPCSKVLEVGTATGYMTKYMKEVLDCQIVGIELDEEAAKQAAMYADEMIVANLDHSEWQDRLQNRKFDYIILADVLEHLRNPCQTLQQMVKYLNDEGKVIASIPNIAHNAIIMELLQDRFGYRPLGLLDNTHIHFFTKNSIIDMFAHTGLSIIFWKNIILKPRSTEFKSKYNQFPIYIQYFLRKRVNGHVYQFVVSANRSSTVAAERIETSEDKVGIRIFSGKQNGKLSRCFKTIRESIHRMFCSFLF